MVGDLGEAAVDEGGEVDAGGVPSEESDGAAGAPALLRVMSRLRLVILQEAA